MQPEVKQEPYFFMKTQDVDPEVSTSGAGGYVGQKTSRLPLMAAICMMLGGLLAVIGPMMEWVSVTLGPVELGKKASALPAIAPDLLKGTASWQGWLIVINGALLALASVAFLLSRARAEGDVSRIRGGIIVAGFITGFTVWNWIAIGSAIAAQRTLIEAIAGDNEATLAKVTDAVQVTWASGLWATIVACLLALSGGVMAVMASAPKVTAIAPGGASWNGPTVATSPRPGGGPGGGSK
ncbi:MAG: hypothetical protein WD670_01880 [Actinomycetota bacterium]